MHQSECDAYHIAAFSLVEVLDVAFLSKRAEREVEGQMSDALARKLPRAFIYWDNSNVFISAKKVAAKRETVLDSPNIRIHFQNLFDLARAGRAVTKAIAVGSIPPEMKEVWDRLKEPGLKVELYERGSGSGTEQGLDQCLQVYMLRDLADEPEPQVAIVLTGDGAGYALGTGFYADLERMHKRGWGVEVISWDMACNRQLKGWAQKNGVYVPLETYYDSVTFIEKGRPAKPLSMRHRPMAIPNTARAGKS
jgi:hypothetical protein